MKEENKIYSWSSVDHTTDPGSWIVITEPDWETFVIDMPKKALTRKVINKLFL